MKFDRLFPAVLATAITLWMLTSAAYAQSGWCSDSPVSSDYVPGACYGTGGDYVYDEGTGTYTITPYYETCDPDQYYDTYAWGATGLDSNCTYEISFGSDSESVTGQTSAGPFYSTFERDSDTVPTDVYVTEQGCTNPCDGFSVIISGASNTKIGCVQSYTALIRGGSGNFSFSWTGSAGGSGSDQTQAFQAVSLGDQWVSVTVTDNVYGCSDSASFPVSVHDQYENFTVTSQDPNNGGTSIATYWTNNLDTPQPFSYSQKFSTSMTVKTSDTGSWGVEELGTKAGISATIETSSTVTCETSTGVGPVTVQPGDTVYVHATPFLNETSGTYTEWDCDYPHDCNFTLDYNPAVSLSLDFTP